MAKHDFQGKVERWYERHKRSLPWRGIKDPYRIWLSEIILQQTRVNQGRPYYEKFVRNYPDIHSLAKADPDEVMKLWEGLGYYSRARNMQEAARYISIELHGNFPDSYEKMIKLKGVGEYTASAVSSFAYDEPRAVLDGNVYRVLSRYLGIKKAVNKAKKEFKDAALEMLDKENPALYNQAIMEFGALQCTPRNPDCRSCVLNDSCRALQLGIVDQLPLKDKVKYNRQRYMHYILMENEAGIVVKQRIGKDIWRGLFEFPSIESGEGLEAGQLMEQAEFGNIVKDDYSLEGFHILPAHKLSHQTIHCRIVHLKIRQFSKILNVDGFLFKSRSELETLAFPRPLRRFLDSNQLTLPF